MSRALGRVAEHLDERPRRRGGVAGPVQAAAVGIERARPARTSRAPPPAARRPAPPPPPCRRARARRSGAGRLRRRAPAPARATRPANATRPRRSGASARRRSSASSRSPSSADRLAGHTQAQLGQLAGGERHGLERHDRGASSARSRPAGALRGRALRRSGGLKRSRSTPGRSTCSRSPSVAVGSRSRATHAEGTITRSERAAHAPDRATDQRAGQQVVVLEHDRRAPLGGGERSEDRQLRPHAPGDERIRPRGRGQRAQLAPPAPRSVRRRPRARPGCASARGCARAARTRRARATAPRRPTRREGRPPAAARSRRTPPRAAPARHPRGARSS